MNIALLLKAIDEYKEATGMKDQAISRGAGLSGDAIRNWRRALAEGKGIGANASSVVKILRFISGSDLFVSQETVDAVAESFAVPRRVYDPDDAAADEDLVRVYDVEASAGHGSVAPEYEAVAYSLSFPPGYLKTITTSSPKFLEIISVKGDSMSPTFKKDDIVMLDRSKRSLGYDGIFVMRFEDTIHVKRVGRSSSPGVVRIISDNKEEFPAFERRIDAVEVIGKVVWIGKKV